MEPTGVAASALRFQLATPNGSNRTNASGIEGGSQEAVETASRLLPQWIPGWTVQLALSLMVIALAWYGSKLFIALVGRRVARRFRRPSISRAVLRSTRIAAMFVAVLVAAAILGVGLSDILLSVTVLTAAAGVVLAPILGSVISGLFVLSDQSYEIGDMIEIVDTDGGTRGFVEDITFQYTKIFTLDNTFLVIPNGTIRDRDVINYSAEDPRTRRSLDVLVPYESDLDRARELVERSAREVDTVIRGGPNIRIGSARYPAAPTCFIDEYADNGVLLTLRYWVEEPYKLLPVRSQVQENIRTAFAEAGIDFPYPHRHLVFDDPDDRSSLGRDGAGTDPNEHGRR